MKKEGFGFRFAHRNLVGVAVVAKHRPKSLPLDKKGIRACGEPGEQGNTTRVDFQGLQTDSPLQFQRSPAVANPTNEEQLQPNVNPQLVFPCCGTHIRDSGSYHHRRIDDFHIQQVWKLKKKE